MLPVGIPPVDLPSIPSIDIPDFACDTHVHMLADPSEFPLWDGRIEDPAPGRTYEDWLRLFRDHLDRLGLSRGVIVHSIFYGPDNSITIETVRRLGRGFKGIGLVTDDVTDAELDRLADSNIKGVRLNYVHGGVLSWDGVKAMAPRLSERGLHVQMLMNTHNHMDQIADDVAKLPVAVCFDHIGWPDLQAGPDEPGFRALRELLADGNAWIKLSGTYRLCNAPYDAADALVAALIDANPERCLWGSDWPHIMLADAKSPDSGTLLNALGRATSHSATLRKILVDNPANLYEF